MPEYPSGGLPLSGGTLAGQVVLPVPNIVFDGDSLTFGYGGMPYGGFPHGQDFPSQVVGSLPAEGSYYNVGVGGETIATMLANAPTAVDPKLAAGRTNVCVLAGGSNDIFYTDADPYANIVAYCQARRAAGWKMVVCTITPRSDTSLPADFETKRQSVNSRLRANWQGYADALADFGNDASIGQAGQSSDTRYYAGDGAHHNVNGYAIRAGYVLSALASLGVRGHRQYDQPVLISDLWLPANELSVQAATATPSYGVITATAYSAWALSHGQAQVVGVTTRIPQDWLSFTISAVYSWVGSGSGSAYLSARYGQLSVAGFTSPTNLAVTLTSGAQSAVTPVWYMAETVQLANVNNNAGALPRTMWNIAVQRNGQAAQDTLVDDIQLLGIYLQRYT
jgi:lysophospholipase L1-like esterase